ncbi:hypothetical protein [Caudoviricetes sp.]|nr:hypothetical protein [Caudoviricetes sp.]UOF81338.1 hypothetical protein [Caudoviricetes sp.]
MTTPTIRKACLFDRTHWKRIEELDVKSISYQAIRALDILYDTEWRKRGHRRSP